MTKRQQGFTLVEIAIVLVIIGLLLGGILKGQEMITQAKIKNSIADFSGISAAYHGYQDRYRAIPGDDANASRWWRPPIADATSDTMIAGRMSRSGCQARPISAMKIANDARKPATVSEGREAVLSAALIAGQLLHARPPCAASADTCAPGRRAGLA